MSIPRQSCPHARLTPKILEVRDVLDLSARVPNPKRANLPHGTN